MTVKPSMFRISAMLVCGALLTAPMVVSPAHAQDTQPSPAEQGGDYSSKELMNYALAVIDVQQIGQSYETQIQAAQSNEELKILSEQRMKEMVNAVENRDMTVEKYNEIFKASQVDPELDDEVTAIINQLLGKQ